MIGGCFRKNRERSGEESGGFRKVIREVMTRAYRNKKIKLFLLRSV